MLLNRNRLKPFYGSFLRQIHQSSVSLGSSSKPNQVWIERPVAEDHALVNTVSRLGADRSGFVPDIDEVAKDDPYRAYHESLTKRDYFGVRQMFTMREMVQARVHLGHKLGTLNDRMKPYLAGERLDVCIFDLDQTAQHLFLALNFLAHMAYRGGVILFVTSDRWHVHDVEKMARKCGEYSHCHQFPHGFFTNSKRTYRQEIRLPDVVVFLSIQTTPIQQHLAVEECAKMSIATVGIVDSNCEPQLISYPVPGNDDSKESLLFYLSKFKSAIIAGKKMRRDHFGVEVNFVE